jgi:hypothetical protein
MRKYLNAIILCLALFSVPATKMAALDVTPGEERFLYSIAVNIVPDGFLLPLVGLVNIAWDTPFSLHLGGLNLNHADFGGLQLGLANLVFGAAAGLQIGPVNYSGESLTGLHLGAVNLARDGMSGVQAGLVNVTRGLAGVQLGLFNVCETVDWGLPVGLVNIITDGGFHSFDVFCSDIAPFNIAYKLGLEKYYSLFSAGFDPLFSASLYLGAGFGGILFLDGNYFFNPELTFLFGLNYDSAAGPGNRLLLSIVPQFGYKPLDVLSFTLGPAITWVNRLDGVAPLRLFGLGVNDNCRLALGLRAGIRIEW